MVADDESGFERLFQRNGAPFRAGGDHDDIEVEVFQHSGKPVGNGSVTDQGNGFVIDAGAAEGAAPSFGMDLPAVEIVTFECEQNLGEAEFRYRNRIGVPAAENADIAGEEGADKVVSGTGAVKKCFQIGQIFGNFLFGGAKHPPGGKEIFHFREIPLRQIADDFGMKIGQFCQFIKLLLGVDIFDLAVA